MSKSLFNFSRNSSLVMFGLRYSLCILKSDSSFLRLFVAILTASAKSVVPYSFRYVSFCRWSSSSFGSCSTIGTMLSIIGSLFSCFTSSTFGSAVCTRVLITVFRACACSGLNVLYFVGSSTLQLSSIILP